VFNRVAGAEPSVTMTWVCDEKDHASVRAMLTAEADRRTQLLHWMPQAELLQVYDDHGIFLFPSFYEGFGKAFLEAMSRGLCPITSGAGGMRDILSPGTDGFILPSGDAAALADAALKLVREPSIASEMSAAAAATARRYSWTRVATETASFYRHLLALRRHALAR
jgi:glycosyltransferase involved in cell wall biosynthesis